MSLQTNFPCKCAGSKEVASCQFRFQCTDNEPISPQIMRLIPEKITPQTIEHFSPDGMSLGFLNELESLNFRIQIAKNDVEGFYIFLNKKRIQILPNGEINDTTGGIYDEIEEKITELLHTQMR